MDNHILVHKRFDVKILFNDAAERIGDLDNIKKSMNTYILNDSKNVSDPHPDDQMPNKLSFKIQ